MTGAYRAFANGGHGVMPYVIASVRDGAGEVLYQRRRADHGPGHGAGASARCTTCCRRGRARHGSGQPCRAPAAGKTGTSQDFRDAWFVGFTADCVAGVWIGNDNGREMKKVTGGTLPPSSGTTSWFRLTEDKTPLPLPRIRKSTASRSDGGAAVAGGREAGGDAPLLGWRARILLGAG